ncbi:hydroxymethylglutaryl-CoA synthase family protein [Mycobacterium sp.]|uniref:hydroxymethylglutaryl-CoA synthase family protein n=1 Tax=Mycobacterium sp. TaxID=1785 RepID=UPI003BAD14A5
MRVGIEDINAYGGRLYLDVRTLFQQRCLDLARFGNLMMERKAVNLPCEDPVTNGVNAAKAVVDRLAPAERDRIEMLITSSESGVDFGKSLSTYIHHYLGLNRRCRLFEVKQACYGGTAALQMAANFVGSGASPGAKALVVATDTARAAAKLTYAEPSQGTGAVALLVGENPRIFELDFGANGYWGYEVMDTCRPTPEIETGDPDLSLMSYLDCLEMAFDQYAARVEGADFVDTFDYLIFHTPFAGMVKGAHRMMMRKLKRAGNDVTESDFSRRVSPGLRYCVEVGNIYSATIFLALCGILDSVEKSSPHRVGCYAYGSGCSAEFFSGCTMPFGAAEAASARLDQQLSSRYELTMAEYDSLLDETAAWPFGVKDRRVDRSGYQAIYDDQFVGGGLLVLDEIRNFHRKYVWS